MSIPTSDVIRAWKDADHDDNPVGTVDLARLHGAVQAWTVDLAGCDQTIGMCTHAPCTMQCVP
ncbi:MAG: hypothetical protein HOV71_25520 [Hamadaea sp.]|nr:hypothetical protein [Hamadaea sp.]NUR51499.1 hypothetical protein [Hamadaea sp.]NUT05933.1 hypothetical protein [Hamadaea sp.]